MSCWSICHFMLYFYWIVSRRTVGRSRNTLWDDHAEFITLSENDRRLSLVGRLWERPCLQDVGPPFRSHDHRNLHDWSSFVWDGPKSYNVYRALNGDIKSCRFALIIQFIPDIRLSVFVWLVSNCWKISILIFYKAIVSTCISCLTVKFYCFLFLFLSVNNCFHLLIIAVACVTVVILWVLKWF